MRLGAHVSIAGGVENAISAQEELGGNCGQIFVSSPRVWNVNEIKVDRVERFRKARDGTDQFPYLVHGKYLINLASPDEELRKRSIHALQRELEETNRLGIEFFVVHPGSFMNSSLEDGLDRLVECLNGLDIPDGTTLLLETMMAKGGVVCHNFEQIAQVLKGSEWTQKELGVCWDTCHLFSAGYPVHLKDGLEETIKSFEKTVGFDWLRFIHLNDSKFPFDSQKDQHEHLGEGYMGEEAFRNILNHPVLNEFPFVLETPIDEKGDHSKDMAKARSLLT